MMCLPSGGAQCPSALAGDVTFDHLVLPGQGTSQFSLLDNYHVFPLVSNKQPVATCFTTIQITRSSSKLRLIISLGEDTLRLCRDAAPLQNGFLT